MPDDVFLSHAAKDRDAAVEIAAVLKQQDVNCWLAPRDVEIGDFPTLIDAAIRGCRIMGVIISENTSCSKWVPREVTRATQLGCALAALRIQDVLPTGDLALLLANTQRFDLFPTPVSQHLAQFIQAIRNCLRRCDLHRGELLLNLPLHYRGRATELNFLHAALESETLRMVTIHGGPGIGKTMLVVKLILDIKQRTLHLASGSDDGVQGIVSLVLTDLTRPPLDRLVECFCQSIDEEPAKRLRTAWQEAGRLDDKLEALRRHALGSARRLIILDNFETVMDDRDGISPRWSELHRFLEMCLGQEHKALLVLTSRLPVRPSGQVAMQSIERVREIPLDAGLTPDEGQAMLKGMDPDGLLRLRDAPDELLYRIVRRWDGNPRLLEIFADTLRRLPASTPETLLDDRRRCMQIEENSAGVRFESLPTPKHKRIMEALAVYGQPVGMQAIRRVVGLDVEDELNDLVRWLVVRMDRDLLALHPLDQQYVSGRIAEAAGNLLRKLNRRAADHFRELRKPQDQWHSWDDLKPQLSEFNHSVIAKDFDRACEILNDIDREYLAYWGYGKELTTMRKQLEGHIKDRRLEEINLGHLGSSYHDEGDSARAITLYEQALEIARAISDKSNESRWVGNIAAARNALGDVREARAGFEEALRIARTPEADPLHIGRWLGRLAGFAWDAGEKQHAIDMFTEALDVTRANKDWRFAIELSVSLGRCYLCMGEARQAEQRLNEALTMAKLLGALRPRIYPLKALAEYHELLGEPSLEIACYEELLVISRGTGRRLDEFGCLDRLGALCKAAAKKRQAAIYWGDALKVVGEIGLSDDERHSTEIQLGLALADLYMDLMRYREAVSYYEHTLTLAEETSKLDVKANTLNWIGIAYYMLGQPPRARDYYQLALVAYRQLGARDGESVALFNIGDAYHLEGNLGNAATFYTQALALDSVYTNQKCALGLAMIHLQKTDVAKTEYFFSMCADICSLLIRTRPDLLPPYFGLAQALYGLAKQVDGLAALERACDRASQEEKLLCFAISDFRMLMRASPSLPGLNDALTLLQKTLSRKQDERSDLGGQLLTGSCPKE